MIDFAAAPSTHSAWRSPRSPRAPRRIADLERRKLDRRVARDVDPKLRADATFFVLEHRVAEAVPRDIRELPRAGSGVADQ